MMIEAAGKRIYIDPAPPGDFKNRPQADLILITHSHPDHLNAALIQSLSGPGTLVLAPSSVAETIHQASVISNGETKNWNGWSIEAVPMYNLKRGPVAGQFFHPKGLGNGYVLSYGGKRFYISGDTEDVPELEALKNIDVAFICMNLPYTMTPDEAAHLARAIHPSIVYPYHSRGTDLQQFKSDLAGSGIDVRILDWYANSAPGAAAQPNHPAPPPPTAAH